MNIQIKEILTDIQSNVGAPCPKIISDEHNAYLFFYLEDQNEKINLKKENNNSKIAKFTFYSYDQFKFGAPNDETSDGHEYSKYGLEPYSINEVINSDWIQYLRKQNSVHPYHSDEKFNNLKHYIFFFHDSCFEIVCEKFNFVIIEEANYNSSIIQTINELN
jgi:hypothetical protein